MKRRVVIVQPVLSPYSILRFEELAKNEELEIILFIERASFSHRPGWEITEVKDCRIEIIGSHIMREKVENVQKGYIIEGIRTIPYRLPTLLAKYNPDIVLVCNATELLFSYALKHVLHYKIGLIVEDTLHAVKTKGKSKKALKDFLYKKADFYLPFSRDAIDYLKDIRIKKPMFRTSWSIDLKSFLNVKQDEVNKIKNALSLDNKLTFLTVSRLDAAKGILKFLKAFRDLPAEILNRLAYMIIGSGPQEEEIRVFVNDYNLSNVHLLGFKEYTEIPSYYHAADVFVLPTLKDLFSLTVMEAMACGLPVLTTIYNGARELVTEGINGYIFDSADIESIKEVLNRTYQNRDKLVDMGRSSLEIIKNFSNEIVIGELSGILHIV